MVLLLIFLILAFAIALLFRKALHLSRAPDPSAVDDPLKDLLLRAVTSRRSYYRNVYLKSDAWQRKRYVVLKRDNWRCVHCGGRATQVHHTRYAKRNIGREPVAWLVSVCDACHRSLHAFDR
jgi:5-methylcytosine-specific restriction endonuclease McrA